MPQIAFSDEDVYAILLLPHMISSPVHVAVMVALMIAVTMAAMMMTH
jgi:hypothetical protein